jgi:uncharacterized membrane protein
VQHLLELVGRLHPILVHLPIGLLVGCAALELAARRLRSKVGPGALSVLTWLAAGAALAAAASGLLLSREEGYAGPTLASHERVGLAIAGTTWLAALLLAVNRRRSSRAAELGYRVFLVTAVLLLVPAGHLGSSLTRGSDWLLAPFRAADGGPTPPASEATPSDPPLKAAPPRAPSYTADIAPIFAAHCASCHGPAKHRGGLRLDSPQAILRGGDEGPVIVPGDVAQSELLRRVRLPIEHEDHMPPEGKPQPLAEELARMEAWIALGAPFDGGALPDGDPGGASPDERAAEGPRAAPSASGSMPGPAEPQPADLERLRAALVHVERLAQDSPLFWIDVSAIAKEVDDARAEELIGPLCEVIGDLGLARSRVGDATLALCARMPRLERLDLRATAVSADGLFALAGHPALQELGLAQTALGDAAVDALLALPVLARVDVWNAGLSTNGLARLRARPGLAVEAGDALTTEALEQEPPIVLRKDRPLPGAGTTAPAGSSAAAAPVNTVCPMSGKPVDPRYTIVHQGRVVAFCCPNCPARFWEAPEAHPVKGE